MTEKFKKQLEDLINASCIDTLCNKPDYELAEMVCDFLSKLVKKEEEKEKSELELLKKKMRSGKKS